MDFAFARSQAFSEVRMVSPVAAVPVQSHDANAVASALAISLNRPKALIAYNTSVKPQLSRDPNRPTSPRVLAGERLTVSIDIGRPQSIFATAVTSLSILTTSVDLQLTVVLACASCEQNSSPEQRVIYKAQEGVSGKAVFQLTPPKRPALSTYTESIQISVINDKSGHIYEQIAFDIEVIDDGNVATIPDEFVSAKISEPSMLPKWNADVLLFLMDEAGSAVTVSIQPINSDLVNKLGNAAFDNGGVRRKFRSGIDGHEILDRITNSFRGGLDAIGFQKDRLKPFGAAGRNAYVAEENQQSLNLSAKEEENVTHVLGQAGQNLYWDLFMATEEPELRQLMSQLEKAAEEAPNDRPLRMVIVTNRLTAPWQLLHPDGDIQGKRFWGMKFSLGVLRANSRISDKPIDLSSQSAPQLLFAQYGRVDEDKVHEHGGDQIERLRKLPGIQDRLIRVNSRKAMLNELRSRRAHLDAVLTFLHASTGDSLQPPYLQFNEGEFLDVTSLLALRNGTNPNSRFFARAPLVILNACETGPSRSMPTIPLADALFSLGARGVVVTEAPVWIPLGHRVASDLYERIGNGEYVTDALTFVRRNLLNELRNPLGLFYSYYGDPSATLLNDSVNRR